MFAVLYFVSCSILLLVAETLLRSVGLAVPLLGFFFVAASFAVSPRMSLVFAMLSGIALDFVMGYGASWSGLLLPLLTLSAVLLHGKRPASDVLDFLIGAAIPLVMAVPNLRGTLMAPEAFASLLTSCLFGAFLFPVVLALVSRSALRLKFGPAGAGNGGA